MPAAPQGIRGAVITGWGSALPPRVLTNDELSQTLDTSDEWIRERSGIQERHIGGTTAGLSVISGAAALAMAGVDPSHIDALVLATTTPDRCVPATSATVQHALGLSCGAFDVNAACSGFVYALTVAHGLIAMGSSEPTLCRASPIGVTATPLFYSLMARAQSYLRQSMDRDKCWLGILMPMDLQRNLYMPS